MKGITMPKINYLKKFIDWENQMTINEWNYNNVVNDLRELIDELEPNKIHLWHCKCGRPTRLLTEGEYCDACDKTTDPPKKGNNYYAYIHIILFGILIILLSWAALLLWIFR